MNIIDAIDAVKLNVYVNTDDLLKYDSIMPITIDINYISKENLQNLDVFDKEWLTQNNISISSLNDDLNIEDNMKAFRLTPQSYGQTDIDYLYAFKALLPPKTVQIDFLNSENTVVYSEKYYKDQGEYCLNDDNYNHWFILKLENIAKSDSDKNLHFEYLIHNDDSKAHSLDIKNHICDLENGGVCGDNSIFMSYHNMKEDEGSVSSCIVKGTVISSSFDLYYLGNQIESFNDLGKYLNPKWNQEDPCECIALYPSSWQSAMGNLHPYSEDVQIETNNKKTIIYRNIDNPYSDTEESFVPLIDYITIEEDSFYYCYLNSSNVVLLPVENKYKVFCKEVPSNIVYIKIFKNQKQYTEYEFTNYTWILENDLYYLDLNGNHFVLKIGEITDNYPILQIGISYTVLNESETVGNSTIYYNTELDNALSLSTGHHLAVIVDNDTTLSMIVCEEDLTGRLTGHLTIKWSV